MSTLRFSASFNWLCSVVLAFSTLAVSACGQAPDSGPSVEINPAFSQPGQFTPIALKASDGSPIQARLWRTETSLVARHRAGIVFVTGIDGDYLEPVDGAYSRLANSLAARGVVSIFVQYRAPGDLELSTEDALAGAAHLRALGVRSMALVGWSFGGAVITSSAVRIPEVRTVVGFAPQSQFTESAARFTHQSILLFHSRADENVPFYASEQILDTAPSSVRKRLEDFEDGDHALSGMADRIDPVASAWLAAELLL